MLKYLKDLALGFQGQHPNVMNIFLNVDLSDMLKNTVLVKHLIIQ